MTRTKDNVVFIFPHPGILLALDVVNLYWRKTFGKAPTITSGRDGVHSENSYHYGTATDFRERAFDVRTFDLTPTEAFQARLVLSRILGTAFDVILEGTHLHFELDLKEIGG
jgi:hypothetical protein